MPEISGLISRWWKQIFVVVIISIAAAAAIVYMKPLQYLSVTTAVPGNILSSDKSRVFSNSIEGLYADIGSSDELDMILGTGQLDTIYLAVTDQFNLYDHYKISKDDGEARPKAAKWLKKNSKVIKSDYGELKVKVWDTDKNLAPQLANALMDKLQQIHQTLQNSNNKKVLSSLYRASSETQMKLDSFNTSSAKDNEVFASRRKMLSEQVLDYTKLINQYELIIDADSESLLVAEKARPSLHPDRPRRLEIISATGILSLLFAFLVALLFDRSKRKSL